MKKYIQYLALFFSIVLVSPALAVNVGLLAGGAAATCDVDFTDDFTVDPHGTWTDFDECFDWEYDGVNDWAQETDSFLNIAYWGVTDTTAQWVKFKYMQVNNNNFAGAALNWTEDGDGQVAFVDDTGFFWYQYGSPVCTEEEQQGGEEVVAPDEDEYIAFASNGLTGTNAWIYYWELGAIDPGGCPDDWGPETAKIQGEAGSANETGKGVGIFGYGGFNEVYVDDFAAGDWSGDDPSP